MDINELYSDLGGSVKAQISLHNAVLPVAKDVAGWILHGCREGIAEGWAV